MYLSTVKIKGYKVFNTEFTATLDPGLNIIVGENGSGKTSIIDAIRLILQEDEYARNGVSSSDFYRAVDQPAKSRGANAISVKAEFHSLSDDDQVVFLPWLDIKCPSKALLNLKIENKEDARGKFKREIWGNESRSGVFEWDLLNRIACIYLPPLRDAEDKLKAYKGSRLARLLKNLRKVDQTDGVHSLEKKFEAFNKDLLRDKLIRAANKSIQDNLIKSVGNIYGQDASIQFAEVNFDRIVERLRLLFYPLLSNDGATRELNMFRELDENCLGYNNILYLSTVLAELEGLDSNQVSHKILLIEEPEAHLHPQIQIRLLQFLENKAKEDNIQVIVTTHSPTLAASVDLEAIKITTAINPADRPIFTSLSGCRLEPDTKLFLQRWLDITKSILLFAKGVLMVEGIAEALVVKELSKYVLRKLKIENPQSRYLSCLEDYGISIINLNGIYFSHFMALFKGYKEEVDGSFANVEYIPIKCAGLTDNDPEPGELPIPSNPSVGTNPQLYLINELQTQSKYCRLFTNLKTFEYDLAMSGNNLIVMSKVQLALVTTNGPVRQRLEQYINIIWSKESLEAKAEAAHWLLNQIDKGVFAQKLCQRLAEGDTIFSIPNYIVNAIKWLVE